MQPSQDINNKKLYFGNLPFTMSQEDLAALVAEFGETTDVSLITDKFSGRSKGFGFVEFVEEEAAKAAMEALDGKEIDGRTIFVKIARPKKPREDRFDGKRRSFSGGNGGNGGRRDFGRDRNNDYNN